MLQLTRKGLIHHGQLDALRDRFATNHCVVLEKILEPALLENVQRQIGEARWQSYVHLRDHGQEKEEKAFEDYGTELILDAPVTVRLLLFLLNNPAFLNVIRMITGCPAISDFGSIRVYRLVAGPQQQFAWHNDMNDPLREVGFSMNLSTDVFRGGTFELRDTRTLTPLAQVNNTGFGDALLFRISSDLEHRVTKVVGEAAKTACVGWFRATGKTFFAELVGSEAVPSP